MNEPSAPFIAPESDVLPEAERRRGQRSALLANLFTGVVQQIVMGALMMLYASDVLGYSPKRVGFIVSVAPLGMLMRFFTLNRVRQSGRIRALRRTALVRAIIIGLLIAIPAARMTFPLFTGLLIAFTLANELGVNVAWQPVLRDITTTADRGRFFARMRFAFTVVTALVTAAIPLFIGADIREWQYKCLLGVALFGAFTFFHWSGRIPEAPGLPGARVVPVPPLAAHLRAVIRRSPLLREPLLIAVLTTFTAFPVFVLYLKEMCHIPSNLISVFLFAGTLGAALSLLAWGRVADTVGFRPMYTGLLFLTIAVQPILLLIAPFPESWSGLFGPRERVTLAALIVHGFLSGALAAGAGISTTAIQHYCVRREDVLESMTLYSSAVVLVSAAVSFVTSWFFQDLAAPAGMRVVAGGWVALDGVKLWILTVNLVFGLALIRLLRRIPNSHPDMEVSDFFESLAGTLGNTARAIPVPAAWLAWLPSRPEPPSKESSR